MKTSKSSRFGLRTALLTAALASLSVGTFAATQISNGEAFLQGQAAELGVRANGAFGSTSIPVGFHANANTANCLGFVVSRGSNGWGAGSQIDGDFFCPGGPFEAWVLTVNGATATNSDSASGIAGSLGNLVVGGPTHAVTWTSTAPYNGIAVQQVYSLANNGQTLNISVTLSNTTGAPINGVQYARIFDPDNATGGPGGINDFSSINTVVGQGVNALIKSQWSNGALVALASTDSRATVAFHSGGAGTPAAIIAGAGWNKTIGATQTGDIHTGLGIDVGTLAAGASTTFTLAYPLSSAAAGAPIPTPTLEEWAKIVFALLLLGTGVFYLRRR